MKLFCDSSALAKRYVYEHGSESMDSLLQKASQLALCTILVTEIISGLNRRRREQIVSSREYRTIKRQLLEDVRDAIVIQITPAAISRSVKLLETNNLRAIDALHVACALEWQAEIFATAAKRQLFAAQNAGLLTEFVGPQDS